MPDWHFENLLTSRRFIGDGHALMGNISPSAAALVFFDPQYRSLLDAMKYGNEGKGARLDARVKLPRCLTPTSVPYATKRWISYARAVTSCCGSTSIS